MESDCSNGNWTEEVEDLVHGGQIDKAISVLETVMSKLEKKPQKGSSSSSELAAALLDLSKLYSSKGLSLKADQTRSLAFQINLQCQSTGLPTKGGLNVVKESSCDGITESHNTRDEASTCGQISVDEYQQESSSLLKDVSAQEGGSDDDWEAAADRAPDELLSPESLPEVSKLSLEDAQVQGLKRRGRGTFSYGRHGMYSDEQSNYPVIDDAEEKADSRSSTAENATKDWNYGTRHVLVLADFPPSTTTSDLEKLLERFRDQGVAIRWVNDTVALAVFRSPSTALEASMCMQCPFTVRVLDETDELLRSIPLRDLEPPRLRPKTSARTAQRLIAQSMGIKLSSTTFGSKELREQEEARRNRIVYRKNMKDDAWGDDDN
ncbi:uncharacterized protein LOC113778084 isoform X2 [Coffea eugenioides]|uniref:uncharacterized protein LOC113777043 isoform X2 n=1 Tax=Coffea eugenioides TaxID=49369 RepID=UPI000F60E4F9|nr:uncharacterized protein LOC113777043 isoform X2 [Coffea eugenioides]XP_027179153.1 uncharacterized protein LOC113778084 isoform X2 [Coffea eugenioides]